MCHSSPSPAPREIYINVDFDLSLRKGWDGPPRARIARQVRDLVPTFLIVGPPRDTLLVHEPLPEGFVAYLDAKGIEHLTPTLVEHRDPSRELVPFGWNEASARLAAACDPPPARPALEIVREVNSRRFSSRLESELYGAHTWSGAFESLESLEERLATTDSPTGQWIVKASHGNAGLGNRRLAGSSLSPVERMGLAALLEDDGCLFLEPWRERRTDLCASFTLRKDGEVTDLGFHEFVNTVGGSFIGAFFGDPSPALVRWGDALEEMTRRVAEAMAGAGYFGPACIDTFTYLENGEECLRPLVDLNARWNISAPGLAHHRRQGREGVLLYRFFAPKDLAFCEDTEDFDRRLGPLAFDPESGRGILLSSPLSLGSGAEKHKPQKVGVIFHGDRRQELLDMERHLREDRRR